MTEPSWADRTQRTYLLAAATVALAFAGGALAQTEQVYRYTDTDGRIVYSDRAPPAGREERPAEAPRRQLHRDQPAAARRAAGDRALPGHALHVRLRRHLQQRRGAAQPPRRAVHHGRSSPRATTPPSCSRSPASSACRCCRSATRSRRASSSRAGRRPSTRPATRRPRRRAVPPRRARRSPAPLLAPRPWRAADVRRHAHTRQGHRLPEVAVRSAERRARPRGRSGAQLGAHRGAHSRGRASSVANWALAASSVAP